MQGQEAVRVVYWQDQVRPVVELIEAAPAAIVPPRHPAAPNSVTTNDPAAFVEKEEASLEDDSLDWTEEVAKKKGGSIQALAKAVMLKRVHSGLGDSARLLIAAVVVAVPAAAAVAVPHVAAASAVRQVDESGPGSIVDGPVPLSVLVGHRARWRSSFR